MVCIIALGCAKSQGDIFADHTFSIAPEDFAIKGFRLPIAKPRSKNTYCI